MASSFAETVIAGLPGQSRSQLNRHRVALYVDVVKEVGLLSARMSETTTAVGDHELRLDPFSADFQQCPFPWFARLREQAPVYEIPEQGWFAVTTMDLAREVMRDVGTYSNQVTRRTLPPAEVADEVAAIRGRGYPYVPTLLLNDPPQHTRFRRLVNKAFTPRALGWMEPLVASAANELAAALPDGDTVDIITAFARPLPVWAISRVLGLGDDRRADVRRWSDAATATIGAQLAVERWPAVELDLLDYQQSIAAELAERRTSPRDDLLSVLVQTTEDGEPLTMPELVGIVRELLVAGNETTVRLIADIVLHLDAHPEEWERVRADPARADLIAEEALRLSSPSQGVFRRVTRDTVLGGVAIPEGALILLWLASANRDERTFADPDTFDPDRAGVRQHVAFGQGTHVCVGAGLARLEASLVVRTLADHVDALPVSPAADLHYVPSFVLRGLMELPVTVQRRSAVH
jgi:cytochrome P450